MVNTKTPLSRQDLGIPDWFFCDGCSHAPDSKWLSPACDRHDWDYWKGSTEQSEPEFRKKADRDLRANIKHNAKYYPGSWFDHLWRPLLGDIYYFAVTNFGKKSWRIREQDQYLDWELEHMAQREGKWVLVE